jgi:hypothetical protein
MEIIWERTCKEYLDGPDLIQNNQTQYWCAVECDRIRVDCIDIIFIKESSTEGPYYSLNLPVYELKRKKVKSSHGFSSYRKAVGDTVHIKEEPKCPENFYELDEILKFLTLGDQSTLLLSLVSIYLGFYLGMSNFYDLGFKVFIKTFFGV